MLQGILEMFRDEIEDARMTDKKGLEKTKNQLEAVEKQLEDDDVEKSDFKRLSKEQDRLSTLVLEAEVVSVFDFYKKSIKNESLLYLYEALLEKIYYTEDEWLLNAAKAWGFALSRLDPKDDSCIISFKDGDLVGNIGIVSTEFDDVIGLIDFFEMSGVYVKVGVQEIETIAMFPWVYHDKLSGDVLMQVFSGKISEIIRLNDVEAIHKADIEIMGC